MSLNKTKSLKALLAKPYAKFIQLRIKSWVNTPFETQAKVFQNLIDGGCHTSFGKDHGFGSIKTHSDFVERVPIRDYEGLKPYVDRVVEGEKNVLWKGKPIYFAKTSGTTSGSKYIPITKDSMPNHIESARNAILMYVAETNKSAFVGGKMIFLQGSPILEEVNGIKTGRLSGIAAHYVPGYLQKNRMPSWATNCIDDWETKVNKIVEETINENMTIISGIPSWVQTYFEKLKSRSGKPIGELFPNFSLFIYGGVNYDPYKAKFESLIGRPVDGIELYPASEGFFAFQDSQSENGMLLQLNSGIFYEFIDIDDYQNNNFNRLTIKDVKTGVNYVMIISTNAGLWAYNLGDTVEFTSVKPYKIRVTGRIKHFISAFGEHVIGKEVEEALTKGTKSRSIQVTEFTVAPQINPSEGLPYHEWFVEFEDLPNDLTDLINEIDQSLQQQNTYYFDLIEGKILQPLKITPVKKNGFNEYMKSLGKLGGQNKVPRLSNNREIADALYKLNLVI